MIYTQTLQNLTSSPANWLVTGAAGFIGSHLTEALLKLNQSVVAMDDLSTGSTRNFEEVRSRVTPEQWARFEFIEASVCDLAACHRACTGVQRVLHEAGFISVPLSIEDPLACNATNVDGFLNVLVAARDAGVERFVYASSSAVYGDDEGTITRDLCHIDNIVQANIRAATAENPRAFGQVYNVALGSRTTLTELYDLIAAKLGVADTPPVYLPPRPGDILHSEASIARICCDLGFEPTVTVDDGLTETVRWYADNRVF